MPLLTALRMAPWVAILGLMLFAGYERGQAQRWHHQFDAEHSARIADRATYEQAQKNAAAANAAQLARIRAQQDKITSEVSHDYDKELADLRRYFAERVRNGQTPAAPGSPKGTGTGGPGQAPGQPDDPARVCIPTGQYVRGAEIELQLDRLIDWNERQSRLNPNQ